MSSQTPMQEGYVYTHKRHAYGNPALSAGGSGCALGSSHSAPPSPFLYLGYFYYSNLSSVSLGSYGFSPCVGSLLLALEVFFRIEHCFLWGEQAEHPFSGWSSHAVGWDPTTWSCSSGLPIVYPLHH